MDKYLESYVYPLFEETRAGLAEAVKALTAAPCGEISGLIELDPEKFLYGVVSRNWSKRDFQIYPGDVLMISNFKPGLLTDPTFNGWISTFAYVKEVGAHLTVKLSDSLKNLSLGDPSHVVFLMNITRHKRMWNSLHLCQNLPMMERVLAANPVSKELHYFIILLN